MANIYLKIEIKQRELISRILIAMHCAIKKKYSLSWKFTGLFV